MNLRFAIFSRRMPGIWPRLLGLLLVLVLAGPARAEDLMQIYLLARERDQKYQEASAMFAAASQEPDKARAALLPSLRADGRLGSSRFENQRLEADGAGDQDPVQHYSDSGYSVTLSQSLLNLQDWARLPVAAARVGEARGLFASARFELILRVSEAYFKVLESQEELAYVRAKKEAVLESRQRALRASELGLVSALAAQQAQASHDLIAAEEIAAQAELQAGWEEMAQITGRRHRELARLTREVPLNQLQPKDSAHWEDLALDHNPTLAARRHALRAAQLEVRRLEAGHLPYLEAEASHAYRDKGGGTLPGEDETSSISVRLSLPIFQGGLLGAQVREALHLARAARARLEQEKRATLKKVRGDLRNLGASMGLVKALGQAVASQETLLRATRRGLAVGTGTMMEVLEAVRDLYNARSRLVRARHQVLLNRLRLQRTLGLLDEEHLRQVNRLLH